MGCVLKRHVVFVVPMLGVVDNGFKHCVLSHALLPRLRQYFLLEHTQVPMLLCLHTLRTSGVAPLRAPCSPLTFSGAVH